MLVQWRWLAALAPALAVGFAGCGDNGEGNQSNNANDNTLCGNGALDGAEECDEGPENSDTLSDRCRSDCRLPGCGDGVVDAKRGELCDCGDGSAPLPAGCTGPNSDGPGAQCSTRCRVPVCGDGVIEADEACDGTNLQGETCESQGFGGGTLECFNCQLWLIGCVDGCGNLLREGDEACDGADLDQMACSDLGFGGGNLACQETCAFDLSNCYDGCGNGLTEYGEQCDGADIGVSTCDGLGFAGGTIACSDDCTWDFSGCLGGCGNGIVETGEPCDDGNQTHWDGCIACAIVEFRVNARAVYYAPGSSVAMANDGRFVVVWQEEDSNGFRIHARQYPATGAPTGPELLVSSSLSFRLIEPAVAITDDGRFAVIWTSEGADGDGAGVYSRRYAADGSALGMELLVNTQTSGIQSAPAVAMGSDGRFVVTWQSNPQDGSSNGVYAQRFDGAGAPAGPELRVNTYTSGSQHTPTVAMSGDGRFVVAWMSSSYEPPTGDGIFAQRYDASGAAQGAELRVNADPTAEVSSPAVAMGDNGHFVVVWSGYVAVIPPVLFDDVGVLARRFDASGDPLSSELLVNTYTQGDQQEPAVALATDGSFVVLWQSWGEDQSGFGVYGQRFDADDQALGPEFRANVYTENHQELPSVAMAGDGRFAVVWRSHEQDAPEGGYNVFGQRYAADGTARGLLP